VSEAIGYIYFDYNDPKSFQPDNILRNLLKQLLFKLRTMPEAVEKLYDDFMQNGRSADTLAMKQQLALTLAKFDRVVLLFDALDEISVECYKDVIALLSDFRHAGSRIFCTSRINTARVRDELGNPAVAEILANQEDIIHYVTTRLDREYDDDDEIIKQKILDCVVEKAEGK